MSASATLFQITDWPRLRRAAFVLPLFCMGGVLTVLIALSPASHQVLTVPVSASLAVGFVLLVAGIIGWLLPLPAARAFVRVSEEGMQFCELTPPKKDTPYIAVQWDAIGEPVLTKEAECWEIRIPVKLGEGERIRYRNRYGGYPRDQDGYVSFAAPVLTQRRGAQALAILNALRSRFSEASAGPVHTQV